MSKFRILNEIMVPKRIRVSVLDAVVLKNVKLVVVFSRKPEKVKKKELGYA